MRPLDLFNAPLAGVQLIEASAGTGKTHTISALYARLIVETDLGVEQILVLTFTRAATAELRQRVRQRLASLQAALSGSDGDEFARELLPRLADPALAQRRVKQALAAFDLAGIFTIHGFCQRVLNDLAFTAGAPFEMEVIEDESELYAEIARDYWRREVYSASPLFAGFLLDNGAGDPQALLKGLRAHLGKPFLKVLGGEAVDCTPAERGYREAWQRAADGWDADAVAALLTGNPDLDGRKMQPRHLAGWIAAVAELFGAPPRWEVSDALARFSAEKIREVTKAAGTPPPHPFFSACSALLAARTRLEQDYQRRLQALRRGLIDFADREIASRGAQRRVQCYSDMLSRLAEALDRDRSGALARALGGRLRAALIDEFQDTDPVQYEIFRRIYLGAGLPVFLVGDPKQAIYGFRGADVYAYLRAREDAGAAHTLTTNWRSRPELIGAVNALFDTAPRPFGIEAIEFHAAAPAPRAIPALAIEEGVEAPLRVWLLPGSGPEPLSKDAATALSLDATAGEVARLLNLGTRRQALIGEQPVAGADIAVLVRSNAQAAQMQRALRRRGVASVLRTEESVFHSREAGELLRVLAAVAEPADEARLRSALLTDMLGASGEALHEIMQSEAAWDEAVERLRGYHERWRDRGFIVMLRRLIDAENVAARLLAYADGERRLTNLLHLAELLQREAARARPGMEGLLQWFAERRHAERAQGEEEQLRLESDEQLVQIVTVHRSKGLEYPIVFCPCLWDARDRGEPQPPFAYHDPQDHYRAVLQLAPAEARETLCIGEETLAEELRLLYVALTRAKHRCYVIWGAVKDAHAAALAWLVHRGPEAECDPAALRERWESLSEAQIRADWERVADRAGGAIAVMPLPQPSDERHTPRFIPSPLTPVLSAVEGGKGQGGGEIGHPPPRSLPSREGGYVPPRLKAREFRGRIAEGWRLMSYSSLLDRLDAEAPDHDRRLPAAWASIEAAGADIFAFPRGARAGSCVHALFEALDFRERDRRRLEEIVRTRLNQHGFGEQWSGALADMVERVLAAPLLAGSDLHLGGLSGAQRLNELEFHYPVAEFDGKVIARILERHGYPAVIGEGERIEDLHICPARGYMKGYIDLVFEWQGRYYLADYKSNWLGPSAEYYRAAQLAEVMQREGYTLQALIYVVALHRLLRQRLPDYDYAAHCGGALYLFVRGIDPALGPDCGVHYDRPPAALIDALDACFCTGEGSGQ